MKFAVVFLMTLACTTTAFAASGWTGPRAILSLETVSSGVEIRLDGFGGACGSTSEGGNQKTWVKLATGQDNEKQHMAVLLMAFATGKPVSIYCSTSEAWPTVSHIIVSGA